MSSPSAASTARRSTRSRSRVGVSQPYLFQLFGTKKDLFIAAVRRAFERTVATFRTAAAEAGEDADQAEILMAMGLAYHRLLDDRSLLLMQMQAYAACDDEEIREVVREEMLRLVQLRAVGLGRAGGGRPRVARLRHAHERGRGHGPHQRRRGLGAHDVPGRRRGLAAMAADAVGKERARRS